MPTGYTAYVQTGTVTNFATFALQCARAFGALVTMREDAMDAPIPDTLAPSSHYAERSRSSRAEIERLEQMTPHQIAIQASTEYQRDLAAWEERQQRRANEKRRYGAMLDQVHAWTPPTPEHQGLKDFMIQQLEESILFDCDGSYDEQPQPIAPEAWHAQRLQDERKYLASAEQRQQEEESRTATRNEWIRQLRNSLPNPEAIR